MNKNKFDPFKDLILDEDEKKIEAALKRGEYINDPEFEKTKKLFEAAAERHFPTEKTKSITIRIKESDLIKVKFRAKDKNLPYQILLKALIHEYAQGRAKIEL